MRIGHFKPTKYGNNIIYIQNMDGKKETTKCFYFYKYDNEYTSKIICDVITGTQE